MSTGLAPTESSFGARLRALRAAAGLTQEELAERAGLTPHGVSALERGARQRPYPHTVRALAGALGLDARATSELLASLPRRSSAAPRSLTGPSGPSQPSGPSGSAVRVGQSSTSRLTTPSTRLFGRDGEIRTVGGLIRAGERLITVVGPGGVGKTRLATAVAAELACDFVDGALQLSLAHTTAPEQVFVAVADALQVPGADTVRSSATLAEHLAGRRILLVLDNLEQVAGVGGPLAALVAASQTVVLTTSRVPLRVRDESVHVLGPLTVPARGTASLADLQSSPAGAMFVDRARSAAQHVPLRDEDAGAVSEICRRLAGIPLALELAAAHVVALGPAQLLSRLDQALSREGATDLPDRQRTLRATLEWSRSLLGPDDVRLLARVSVFRGGFTLEAAEGVAGPDRPDTWSTLEKLVEHSLVQVGRDQGGAVRYRLLEPVAEYAASLMSASELAEARDAHAAYVLALAEEAAPQYTQRRQIEWLDRLDLEDANTAVALAWTLSEGRDPETAARLGWALWLFWWLRGRQQSGRLAMEEALRHELPQAVAARAHLVHGAMTFALGDLEASAPSWRRGEELAERSGEVAIAANGRAGSGIVALAAGRLEEAGAAFRWVLETAGDRTEWTAQWVTGLVEIWLGTVLFLQGDRRGAGTHFQRGLTRARGREDRLTTYVALFNLGQVALADGDLQAARTTLREAAALSVETRDAANLAFVLDALAVLAAAEERFRTVPLLVGAAEAMRETAGGHVYGYYVPDPVQYEAAVAAARGVLGDDVYDDQVDSGRRMTFEEAVAAAYDA